VVISPYPFSDGAKSLAMTMKTVSLSPDQVTEAVHTYCRRGSERRARGDLAGALADFEQALAADPSAALARHGRGMTRHLRGDLAGAIADYDEVVRSSPGHAQAFNNRGLARHAQGDHAGAIADYDRALALNPGYAEALGNRGLARHAQGDHAGAIADYDQALAFVAMADAATLYHNRGAARQALDDLDGALADFDRALAINPRHTATYNNRGTVHKARANLEAALADFNQALALTPRPLAAPAYHHRGGIRVLLNDFAGAIADYDEALRINPQFYVAYLSRGNARYHQRDLMGYVDYRMAFRLNAEESARELVRILAEDMQRGPEAVLENCRKHLRISPNDLTAYARRGLTLLLLGRDADAEADFAQAQALTSDARAHIDLIVQAAREHLARPGIGGAETTFPRKHDGHGNGGGNTLKVKPPSPSA
jgi:tetratricopeptide (TPR) repeat protein